MGITSVLPTTGMAVMSTEHNIFITGTVAMRMALSTATRLPILELDVLLVEGD